MESKMVIAIVDPYSSGSPLAREVTSRGHVCIAVQSVGAIPKMYRSSFHAEDFDAIISHGGDLQSTCDQLASHHVRLIIPGCEMGVELSDQLSERMGLVSNGTHLSRARRNKDLMVDRLRSCGVRTPESFSTHDLDRARQWVGGHNRWPVVIKPLRSSGSDGVALCHNVGDVERQFERITAASDVFGDRNDAVILQEYVAGTEYAVDTVSHSGHHKLVALWLYASSLPSGAFLGSESLELLPHDDAVVQKLFPTVAGALDALGISHGPAHCELIVDQEGPVIVEIGARLNGGNNPLLSAYAGGVSQIELTLDAYLDTQPFLQRLDQPYTLSKHAMRVFLIPPRQDRLRTPPCFDEIQRLESFHELRFSAKPGQVLSRIAGWVLLVHPDRNVVHRDRDEIRRQERAGLYPL